MTPTEAQKRLVIVGATGMVGGYALRCALDHPAVGTATAIGRKPTGLNHPKLNEVLHQDFADCSALAGALSGQDAAVFCLGAYTGAVADAELRRITVDYTIEFARVLRGSSPNATFAFLSGGGADPTGRSRIAYARYKGEAEKALAAAGFPYANPLARSSDSFLTDPASRSHATPAPSGVLHRTLDERAASEPASRHRGAGPRSGVAPPEKPE